MDKWVNVYGVEPGEQPPAVLLYSFPAEQWDERLKAELEKQGITEIRVEELERD